MMKKTARVILVFILLMILAFPALVSADMGPKPSITVYVKGFKAQDYYLDLLSPSEPDFYRSLHREYPESYRDMPLYKYNEQGWMAQHIRNNLLFGSLKGEYDAERGMMVHRFSYHGVPHVFKVIVQDQKGQLHVSNEVTPRRFKAEVIYDMETGSLTVVKGVYMDFIHVPASLAWTVFVCLLSTILIELAVAVPFRIRPLWAVLIANIITQALLHGVLIGLFYSKWYAAMGTVFLLLELVIPLLEFGIYRLFAHGLSWKRLLLYSVAANLATFFIGVIIGI